MVDSELGNCSAFVEDPLDDIVGGLVAGRGGLHVDVNDVGLGLDDDGDRVDGVRGGQDAAGGVHSVTGTGISVVCWGPARVVVGLNSEPPEGFHGVLLGLNGEDFSVDNFEAGALKTFDLDFKHDQAEGAEVFAFLVEYKFPSFSSPSLYMYSIFFGIKVSTQCFLLVAIFSNLILICELYFDGFLINSKPLFDVWENKIS